MPHGMCWNVLEWHWNGLEWPMEWVGMGWNLAECTWNVLEWPLESSRMNLEFVGMEFHLDSIGIRQNDRFQPFRRIPDGIPTFRSESVGVCQKPWGRVKYCVSSSRSHINREPAVTATAKETNGKESTGEDGDDGDEGNTHFIIVFHVFIIFSRC